jgi:threonylcarbamoyladenosine tRNA methylthiotransferase MtaB
LIEKSLSDVGFDSRPQFSELQKQSNAKIHILNTCAVTEEAVKQAKRLARKIKSMDPFSLVVITGCASQVDTGAFAEMPAVDLIVANSHKNQLPQIIDDYFKNKLTEKIFKSNIFKKDELDPGFGEKDSHTRVFLKIQDGCNSFCTYCVIPFARGKSRSLDINSLVQRINGLSEKGINEIVLTGIHIGDYQDNDKGLDDLIESVLNNTDIPRIRLTSLEPIEVTDRMLELFKNPRMCPHFHMSIQSANDQVLTGMKRKYTQADVVRVFEKIKSTLHNPFIGMDVIVGFPNETDECFEDTLNVLKNSSWNKIHVFPYSERPGTRAVAIQSVVSDFVKSKRAKILRELSSFRFLQEQIKQIGDVKKCLVLKDSLLSRDYWKVLVPDHDSLVQGTEVDVLIKSYRDDVLLGEFIGSEKWN